MNDIKIPMDYFNSVTDWINYNYTANHLFSSNHFVGLMDLNPTFVDGAFDGVAHKVVTKVDYVPNFIKMPNDGNVYAFVIDFGSKRVVIDYNNGRVHSPFVTNINNVFQFAQGDIGPLVINSNQKFDFYNLYSRAKFKSYELVDYSNRTGSYIFYRDAYVELSKQANTFTSTV